MKPLAANDPVAIGSYRLVGVLGGGGMGRVYLAESRTGRRVAIKVIRQDLAEDSVFRRRFEREVTAARTVSPLFTAAVVDADTAATEPWFATTYIDGPSLLDLVTAEGRLGPGAVLTLAAGLAEALASIHQAGLVHRDVTPSNVILDDDGPHIIDFGIVLAPGTTRLTSNLMMGTPSYIAPEIIHGEEAGPPSDVFALGATLAFAASGRQLVSDGSAHAQMLQITAGKFDLSAVPRELRPLIVRCLSARPKDRPTAEELARILVAARVANPSPRWYASTTPAPWVDLQALPSVGMSRRRLLVISGAAGAAAIGAGVAAWAGIYAGRPQPEVLWSSTPTGSTQSPAPTRGPLMPGDIVWLARSGVIPVAPSPAARQSPTRIIVDRGERLIAANGSQVFAVGLDGVQQWSTTLESGLVNLWPWGDAVLVSDPRRLWLLDMRSGAIRFTRNAAELEEKASAGDNLDHLPVQIGGVAVNASTAFVGLGTAMVAFSRSLVPIWRRARPNPRNGVRPPAGVPLAISGRWLVTHDPAGAVVDLSLRDINDKGKLQWLQQYPLAPAQTQPAPPPPGGPGGAGGPGGPGGPPGNDEAWTRSEGRIGSTYIVIREIQEVRAFVRTTGVEAWHQASLTPIAGVELVGDTVLVAADRLRAYAIKTDAHLWEVDRRGARVAAAGDGRSLIVASEQGVSAVDFTNGFELWHTDWPDAVFDTIADRITIDGDLAYVTFRPKDERSEPMNIDVIAVKLGVPT